MYFMCAFDLLRFYWRLVIMMTMKLSTYSDYAVRVLMQTALRRPERVTVAEVAQTFGISRHHLVKVVHDLGRSGYLATQRGIGGGFTLALAPEAIRLGDIVRLGEETEQVIDCRNGDGQPCRLYPACRLKGVLDEAAAAFFAVLDRYTLDELIQQPAKLRALLGIEVAQ
jgi:Rrf2 family nitric oxide-sensitive transcriptional repressor